MSINYTLQKPFVPHWSAVQWEGACCRGKGHYSTSERPNFVKQIDLTEAERVSKQKMVPEIQQCDYYVLWAPKCTGAHPI